MNLLLKAGKSAFSIFMIGLCCWIDPIICHPSFQIARKGQSLPSSQQSSVPEFTSGMNENSFPESPSLPTDYSSAYNSISNISPLGHNGKGKAAAPTVNTKSDPKCGVGLVMGKATRSKHFGDIDGGDVEEEDLGINDVDGKSNTNNVPSSSSSLTRIVNGMTITVPWQAYISEMMPTHVLCGGSLLNQNWVLTAQHCQLSKNPKEYVVYFGSNEPNKTTVHMIEKVVDLPGYKERNHNNDFTLVKLKKPVTFSKTIGPVCLPAAGQSFDMASAIVSGWGHTVNPDGPFPEQLMSANFKIKNSGCEFGNETLPLTATQICGDAQDGSKSCQGDSGGPVMVKSANNKYVLAGVVSAAYERCASAIIFGEVANAKVMNFILSNAFAGSSG